MKTFKIPREVRQEDRIWGPITWRRLIILLIGGGISYLFFDNLLASGVFVWAPPVLLFGSITVAVAFLEPFGMRFEKLILRFIEFLLLPRQRIWDNRFSQNVNFMFYKTQANKQKNLISKNEPTLDIQLSEKRKKREKLSEISPLLNTELDLLKKP